MALTADVWSRATLESFLAVTGHYMAKSKSGQLVLKSELIAFRKLVGSHTGANMGTVFVRILKETDILHKVYLIFCHLQVTKWY